MLVGAVITYQADDIYSSECVRQTCSSSGVFASGFSPPKTWELGEEENYTFNGTGNPTECSRIIREVFDLTDCYRSGVCVGSKYFWPPVNNSGTFLVCVDVCVSVCVCVHVRVCECVCICVCK